MRAAYSTLFWAVIFATGIACKPQSEEINKTEDIIADELTVEDLEINQESSYSGVTRGGAVDGRKKYFGVLYNLWHCASIEDNGSTVVLSDIFDAAGVAGMQERVDYFRTSANQDDSRWRGRSSFSWWSRPAVGPYCLTNNTNVLTRHASYLKSMGIDYIVIDVSNHPNVVDLEAQRMIMQPLRSLLQVWSGIQGAPKVVPWVPFQPVASLNAEGERIGGAGNTNAASTLNVITDLMKNEYPGMRMPYNGKYLLGMVNDTDRFADTARANANIQRMQADWHVFKMWGLRNTEGTNDWSFLSPCVDEAGFRNSLGMAQCDQRSSNIQISVAMAYQSGYATRPDMTRKFHGRTVTRQFEEVYRNPGAQFVMFSTFNEWIAQIQKNENTAVNGVEQYEFVDQFDLDRNRDIEPGGGIGDYYLRLITKLIANYRRGLGYNVKDYILTNDGIFNHGYYGNKYPNVKAQVGASRGALIQHWVNFGMNEGRSPNPFFDPQEYKKINKLDGLNNKQLLEHFIADGFYEGRRGSFAHDARTYLRTNSDLSDAYGSFSVLDGLYHYNRTGYREQRPRVVQRQPDGFGGPWGACYVKYNKNAGWTKLNRGQSFIVNCRQIFENDTSIKAMMMNNQQGSISPAPFIATRP